MFKSILLNFTDFLPNQTHLNQVRRFRLDYHGQMVLTFDMCYWKYLGSPSFGQHPCSFGKDCLLTNRALAQCWHPTLEHGAWQRA